MRGKPVHPKGLQYGDFAVAEADVAAQEGSARASSLAFWSDYVAGCTTSSLRRKVKVDGEVGHVERLTVTLSERDSTALLMLARDTCCTPFMVLLASYEIALSHLTGSDEVLVPTTNEAGNPSRPPP
jgi:hypothetical protein